MKKELKQVKEQVRRETCGEDIPVPENSYLEAFLVCFINGGNTRGWGGGGGERKRVGGEPSKVRRTGPPGSGGSALPKNHMHPCQLGVL